SRAVATVLGTAWGGSLATRGSLGGRCNSACPCVTTRAQAWVASNRTVLVRHALGQEPLGVDTSVRRRIAEKRNIGGKRSVTQLDTRACLVNSSVANRGN